LSFTVVNGVFCVYPVVEMNEPPIYPVNRTCMGCFCPL